MAVLGHAVGRVRGVNCHICQGRHQARQSNLATFIRTIVIVIAATIFVVAPEAGKRIHN
jgi:hypothetical protein